MTLRLILIRHAKSSWDDPTIDDHDRPLNARGRNAATALGKWLASRGYVAEQALCSSAARTTETCDLILENLQARPEVELNEQLYHATPEQMLDVLRGAKSANVMMFGHNPGCAYAAGAFAAKPPVHPRSATYPTGATTVYEFDIATWDQANWGGGRVLDFVVPMDLGVD